MTMIDEAMDDIDTTAAVERAVAVGAILDLAGATIAAELIRRVCLGREANVDPRGVRLRRAVITGALDLTGVDVPFPIRFDECEFEQALTLHGARVKELIIT